MNRASLQKLSELRLREAKVLLTADHSSGAYYLAGYAVECAIKAVIASTVQQFDFPNRKLATDSHIHDLIKLMDVAGLKDGLNLRSEVDSAFSRNWMLVKESTEVSRYTFADSIAAQALLQAIENPTEGVLPWIMQFW